MPMDIELKTPSDQAIK